MLLLSIAVLSLVGVMTVAVQTVTSSSARLIAREKAREAVESVHSARDTGELAWSRVRNVSDGGDVLDGLCAIRTPGLDGLVNTADDGPIEVMRAPGPDGVLQTSDDMLTPLNEDLYQREIRIDAVTFDGSATINPNLRRITVTVRFRVVGAWQTYSLTTFVSSYS